MPLSTIGSKKKTCRDARECYFTPIFDPRRLCLSVPSVILGFDRRGATPGPRVPHARVFRHRSVHVAVSSDVFLCAFDVVIFVSLRLFAS